MQLACVRAVTRDWAHGMHRRLAHLHFDPAKHKCSIIYQDERMLVLNKLPGLSTQGSKDSLATFLHKYQGGSPQPPRLVHRLDKDTSGVLILARTNEALTILSKQFETGAIRKSYVAIAIGVPNPARGTISSTFEKKLVAGKWKYIPLADGALSAERNHESSMATTEYEVLAACGLQASLVQLHPLTGRHHQVDLMFRVPMSPVFFVSFTSCHYFFFTDRASLFFCAHQQ